MIKTFLANYWELVIMGLLLLNTIIQKLEKIKGNSDILTWIWQFLTWIKSITRQLISVVFSTKPGKLPMLFIGIFLLIPSLAFAEPFLVCDPQTNVTHYVITGDINVTVPATDLGDGTVRLQYDLNGIAEGTVNLELKAKNIWGESVAVPFDFVKALPAVPGGTRIE